MGATMEAVMICSIFHQHLTDRYSLCGLCRLQCERDEETPWGGTAALITPPQPPHDSPNDLRRQFGGCDHGGAPHITCPQAPQLSGPCKVLLCATQLQPPPLCLQDKQPQYLRWAPTCVSPHCHIDSPANVDRRMAIRDTWGAASLPNYAMPVIFLLGDTNDFTAQTDIHSENKIYSDIIQESFVDSHSNLTLKTVMAYKWARTFCPRADFVLVTTDNVIIDTFKLAPYLLTQRPQVDTHFILCHLVPCCPPAQARTMSSPLHPGHAWQQYTGKAYPAHCSGHAYVLPSTVIHKMYVMSLDTQAKPLPGTWGSWLKSWGSTSVTPATPFLASLARIGPSLPCLTAQNTWTVPLSWVCSATNTHTESLKLCVNSGSQS